MGRRACKARVHEVARDEQPDMTEHKEVNATQLTKNSRSNLLQKTRHGMLPVLIKKSNQEGAIKRLKVTNDQLLAPPYPHTKTLEGA